MSHVTFYLMQDDDREALVCRLIAETWSGGHIYCLCRDEGESLALDDRLWQLPADRFVPHQLQGETGQAPVEIGHQPPRRRYARLINLTDEAPLFAGEFAQVVDFVPTNERDKQQARERYKAYRQAGHTLEMLEPPPAPAP
ncbi:DNA polymerase III subunit chi [Aeromonas simiae]|uniref:DNA polymerase III subunit chi n=1 Tax=Aeromonas simiae TaxID=218936 RepID=UPI00266BF2D4|nr:DNA polymerase III subunit chi [Aeromonas simiae]MDO2948384.1 DNA polymerase III subunit chi [Aeromonas simiae]MDO2951949.1 DNA polymerase III subunit chi [Aeromonas simiae]MDO2955767.1 DNA polymerase III subunit chi [Aeromonas simiae]